MIDIKNNNDKLIIRIGEDWLKFKFSYEYKENSCINDTEIFRYDLLTEECKSTFNDIFNILKLDFMSNDEINSSKM